MRIATWNIKNPSATAPQSKGQLDHMERIGADIWVLTETTEGLCPPKCTLHALTDPDASLQGIRLVGIYSSRHEVLGIETTWDSTRAVCVRLDTPKGELIVYGTVLPWNSCTRYHPNNGSDAYLYALQHTRQDWDWLIQKHPNATLCVAGDFNQDLDAKHYYGSNEGRAALRHAIDQVGLECLTAGNRDPVKEATNGLHTNIDHICVSQPCARQFTTNGAWPQEQTLPNSLSDHFGVWAQADA